MRFLHTADWQIGMSARHVGAAGERVREARFAAAERVVEVARERGAEFVVVAGDTFEDNGVDRASVRRVGELLARAGVPVFLLPGNHDPLETGSVWEHDVWTRHASLHVLRDTTPVDVPGGRLHPAPITAKRSRTDPAASIDAAGDTGIAIGVTHGCHAIIMEGGEDDHPIAPDAASRAGLDYLAIGHWHSTTELQQAARLRIAYAGTHEQTKFGERDSGNVLLVDVLERGATPQLERVRTGGLTWRSLTGDDARLAQPGDLRAFVDRHVEPLVDAPATLLRIGFTGVLRPDEAGELARIDEILDARGVLYRAIDTSELMPPPDDNSWLDELDGIVRHAADQLWRRANGRPTGSDTADGFPPEVARQALLELFLLQREATA